MKFLTLAVLLLGLNAQAWQDDHSIGFEDGYNIGHSQLRSTRILCESKDYKTRQCGINGYIRDVNLVRQLSKTACIQGQTFNFNTYDIVVSGGCRGEFEVLYYSNDNGGGDDDGGYNPPHEPSSQVISCASTDYKYNSCFVNGAIGYVELISQKSKTTCIKGSNYGANYDRIWVDKGCSGTFRVYLR